MIRPPRASFAALVVVCAVGVAGVDAGSVGAAARSAASSVRVDVAASDNIYGAGLPTAPDPGGGGAGTLPVELTIGAHAPGVSVSFSSVAGSVSCCSGGSANGPDGGPGDSSGKALAIDPFQGLSGIHDATRGAFVMYLTGVFLGTSRPASAPASLDFTGRHPFAALAPRLGQVFFVGDGLTGRGKGRRQEFRIPAGATRLYLGFADAYGFHGAPGYYGDNVGALAATVESNAPLSAVGAQPSSAVLSPLSAEATVGSRFSGALALLTYAAGTVPPSVSATIDWGDGASSKGEVRSVLSGQTGSGGDVLGIVGTHTYRKPGKRTATVTVTAPNQSSRSTQATVTVHRLDPTALFFSNPGDPTNGDIALLVPAPPSDLQRPVERYAWHFSDGYPVIDTSENQKRYLALLHALDANPSDDALKKLAVRTGILPPGAAGGAFGIDGLSADQVRQVVGVWLAYFPHHMVPHIYPRSGTEKVALEVTDSAGKTSIAREPVTVTDHCLEWGGPIGALFGHTTTCDTVKGLEAVAGGPKRWPDYYSFEFSFGGGFASAGVNLTVTHDGTVFLGLRGSLGPSVGAKNVGKPLSAAIGYVGAPVGDPPSDSAIDNFVVGLTIPVQAGVGPLGLNLVLNPSPFQSGVEYGVNGSPLSAALNLGASCSIKLGRIGDLSALAPSDQGSWPPQGPLAPTLPGDAAGEVLALLAQNVDALRSCGA